MDLSSVHAQVGVALAGLGAMLLAGKGLRRLILLPFEYLARKTPSKVDDVLVKQVEADLEVSSVLEEADAADAKK